MMDKEQVKPEPKPINGERAFQDSDPVKHSKVVSYVNGIKDAWFNEEKVKAYFDRIDKMHLMVNQRWGKDKTTRFGLRHALMRAAHDSYIDTFTDLFSTDDLIMYEGDTAEEAKFAHDMQLYTNRLLRSVKYKRHLNQRFLFLPVYGWSPAHDYYCFNEGWATKANAKPYMPGLDGLQFGKEMDALNDGPMPEVIRPEHCFFGAMAPPWEQQSRGSIKRWYLRDIVAAEKRATKDGKPLYNLEALKKVKEAMIRGQSQADANMKEKQKDITRDIDFKDKTRGPYVDVVRFYGPLNEINDVDLAEDGNTYYIECTQNDLLLWTENPSDRHTMFTDMRTHSLIDSPLSRSFLDSIYPHQQFTDFLTNMSMESITDNLTKHYAVWEEDMEDPNDFYSPKGLNAFLRMSGPKLPQIIEHGRSGAFADVKEILVMLDRDRQRAGASDQEMGALGETQDKTATGARIMATAATKRTRATAKRISDEAIIPQANNLTMLSLVHGKPEMRKFIAGGKEITITPEHVQWYLNGANVKVHDSVVRDRNEEAVKITAFFQGIGQMVGQLADPTAAVYIMRHAADVQGIPQHIIDKALPEPMPPQIPGPVVDPAQPQAMPPMPPEMPQPPPMPEMSNVQMA
jgi:hypothetical protein